MGLDGVSVPATSIAAAPSVKPGALPAVTVPLGANAGCKRARASLVVSARGPSSVSTDATAPFAAGHLDWHDLGLEAAGVYGRERALVAAQRVFVLLLAGDAALFGDRLRAHAHVVIVPRRPQSVGDDRVQHGGRTHAIAEARFGQQMRALAHAFHAASHDQRRVSRPNRVGGLIDRFQARGAHLVERGRVRRRRDAGADRCLPSGRLAHASLHDLAHDDLVDSRGIDVRALDRGSDGRGAKLRRGNGRPGRPSSCRSASAPPRGCKCCRRCCGSYRQSHLARDDELQDLARAFANRQNFGVPVVARDG